MRRLALAMLVATGLLGAGLARAAMRAPSVIIVRPANSPPVMVETLVRLKGELTSAGFDTEIVDGAPGAGDSRAALEQLAARRGADAVVAIVGDLSPDSVEVWVIDKVTGKTVVRRVPFEPAAARASTTLAIRAIELLRSSFLEIDLAAQDRRNEPGVAPPPPAVVRFVEVEREARRPEHLGVEVGGAAVMSVDGVGPALLPLVRLDWAPLPWLIAQAALAGLGTRATVSGDGGSAQVAQSYGLIGANLRFRTAERLRPFVALAAGALHTSVEGRADAPNQGRVVDQWSLLFDAGAGAQVRLPDRFTLSLAAHAQVAQPYVAVRFVGGVVATSARPNLLLTLTIGAWL